ncbi:MAG: GAF domain-containing protein [Chloroflexi bacterium]|nr:GAF domain-containing protein [Chloroflexota bacterium]
MRSLRAQLGLIFLAFLLLVSGSVTATFLTIRTQASDELVISLAGRLRLLIQQMTIDALEAETHILPLQESIEAFDTTLQALTNGGQVLFQPGRLISVPPAQDSEIVAGLQQVQSAWDVYREHLNKFATLDPNSPEFETEHEALESLATDMAQKTDHVENLFEAASARKVGRLQWLQLIFLVSALALLVIGSAAIQRLVIGPLQSLTHVAERIGRGDLNTAVQVQGSREILTVSQSFETMRGQLQTSQETLRAWTEELEARVARRTRELVALYEVSREISSRLDINHVLRSVTEKARDLLGGDTAALCLLDETAQVLNLQSASGSPEAVSGTRSLAQDPPAVRVLAGDRALICGRDECPNSCGILAAPFRVSQIAAPLRIGGRVTGELCVGSQRPGAFSDESAGLLTKLANSVAIALENARLYEQAERLAMLEERQRIAAEMHDGIAQTLSYLSLKAEQAADLAQAGDGKETAGVLQGVREAIAQASREARQAIASLQESPPRRRSLQDQLTELASEAAVNGGSAIDLTFALQPPPLFLPPAQAEQVRRVIREALLNTWRHAQAEHIVVRLEQRGVEAVASVEDDGRGFDPKAPLPDRGSHFGLSIMRARAARLGGHLTILSASGQGTRVTLAWPLPQTKDEEQLAKVEGR